MAYWTIKIKQRREIEKQMIYNEIEKRKERYEAKQEGKKNFPLKQAAAWQMLSPLYEVKSFKDS